MSISPQREQDKAFAEDSQKAAYPFCCVIKSAIPLKDLSDPDSNGQIADELLVSVDLKNIKVVEDHKVPTKFEELKRTIEIEVIDGESFRKMLNQKHPVLGVTTSEKESYSVYASRSISLWANRKSDQRYWLCERLEDGRLVVKTCLNKAKLLECFDDICACGNQGIPSVTLFMETASSTSFQEVDEDSILIFAKLHNPEYEDLSYLGHWIVKKSMNCHTFHERIVMEKGLFKDDEEYTAHLERGRFLPMDITNKQCSLEKCGIGSGSVVILEKKANHEQNPPSPHVHVTSRGIPFEEIEEACGSASDAQRADQQEDSQRNDMPHQTCMTHPLAADHLEEDWTFPARDLPEAAHSKPRRNCLGRLLKPKILMVMAKGLRIAAIFVGVNLIVRSQLHPPWSENFEDIPKMLGWYGDESTNILKQDGFTWDYALDD